MKAAIIRNYGGPDELVISDLPDPVLGPDEVLLQVAAASINPVDLMERAGATKDYRPISFPGVLGWDVAGTVLAMGDDVTGFAIGDKVLAWAYHTYAELCVVKARLLVKVSDGLDLADAAALPLVTLTGAQLVATGAKVQPGQSVLVSGAVGGVGRSAVFMAKKRGAHVIAGVTKSQADEAASLGADAVLALDDPDALAGLASVDIVANTVRGATATLLLGKVKAGGVFASVTGVPDGADAHASLRVVAFVSKQDRAMLAELTMAVRDGLLSIPIGLRLPLAQAAAGHAAVAKGGIGKVLLLP
jgi:NADPH:quinone reductase-like Zn-dependent oxidoreductase